MAIPIEVIEFGVAAIGVAVFSILGAKYGAKLYIKLSAVATEVEGVLGNIEEGFPAQAHAGEGGIYAHGKTFLADAKDILADGKVEFLEMRRLVKDGEVILDDLMTMYAQLKVAAASA